MVAIGPVYEGQPILRTAVDGVTEIPASGLELWENKTWKHLRTLSDANPPYVFSPDGKTLATNSGISAMISFYDPGLPVLWDIATGTRRELSVEGFPGSLDFSPDGQTLAVYTGRVANESGGMWGRDGTMLFDVQSAQPLRFIETGQFVMQFSPDGSLLSYRPDTHELALWDVESGEPYATFAFTDAMQNQLYDFKFSPDGRLLAAASPGRAFFWNVPQ